MRIVIEKLMLAAQMNQEHRRNIKTTRFYYSLDEKEFEC